MLKHEVLIGILGSFLVLILTGFYVFKYQQLPKAYSNLITEQKITLTPAEVGNHKTVSDCWIIVNNNVYNVTNYISVHPGGSDRITAYCGQDATKAFETKGGSVSHSTKADRELNSLLIGSLGVVVSAQTIKNSENFVPRRVKEEEYDND